MTVAAQKQPVPGGVGRSRQYPAYKQSGLEWLGKIPAHWAIAPVYARYQVALGKMLDEKRITGMAPGRYIRNVNVQWDRVDIDDLPEMDFTRAERERYRLREGDLLVCEGGEVGRTAMWRGELAECFYQKAVHRVRPNSLSEVPRFFYYLMYSLARAGVFVAGGNSNTIDHLTAVQLKHYRFAFPPSEEQRAIVAFLDREAANIDALIAKKERLIALLQEKRAALVAQTVTKGLDTSVLMRDSGVEWLGRIPQHWYVLRVRELAESLQTGPFGTELHADQYVHAGVPVINPANLRAGQLVPDLDSTVDANTAGRLAKYQLAPHDVLFARRGEMGRCGMATQQQAGWICGTGCLRLRVRAGKAVPQFLLHLLSTARVKDWLELRSVGSTMQNLNTSVIGSLPIALPPLREQQVLSAHLDWETAQIFRAVAQIDTAIDRLREFRLALVAAAVTGEIDVRERAAA